MLGAPETPLTLDTCGRVGGEFSRGKISRLAGPSFGEKFQCGKLVVPYMPESKAPPRPAIITCHLA